MRASATALVVFLLVAQVRGSVPAQQGQTPSSSVDRTFVSQFVASDPDAREALIKARPEIIERAFREFLVAEGNRFRQARDFEKAEAHFRAAIHIGERHNQPATVVSAMNGLMLMTSTQGDHDAAIQIGNDALAIATATSSLAGQQLSHANIAIAQRRKGDLSGSLASQGRALEMARQMGEPRVIARSLYNIGVVRLDLGEHAKSLDNLLESLELDTKAGASARELAGTFIVIGGIYGEQSEYALAATYYQRAIDANGSEVTQNLAGAYNNLAFTQMAMGNDAEALKTFERALPMARQVRSEGVESTIVFNLGQIARRAGRLDEAEAHQRQALALREKLNQRGSIVESLNEMASLLTEAKRPLESLPIAERALALATESKLIDGVWRAEMVTGHAYAALGRDDEARRFYERSIQTIEKMRALSADGSMAMQTQFKGFAPYYGLAALEARAGRSVDALRLIDRSRARTLVDILSTQPAAVAASGDALAGPDRGNETRWTRGVTPEPTSSQIAALLAPGRAIVSFVLDDKKAWAYVTTLGPRDIEVSAHALPLSADGLVTVTNRFTREVSSRNLAFAAGARAAYNALLGPIESRLSGISDLIIVAEGELWRVPFQALRTSRDKFLVEERAVSYTPSIAALVALAERRRARPAVSPFLVAVGDPAFSLTAEPALPGTEKRGAALSRLPESAREARSIGRLYGAGRSAVLVDSAATESALRQRTGRATILHLATHSVLDDLRPMSSRLMLARGDGASNENDGRLEAWELMQMQNTADIAVLSACQTGRGGSGYGEGLLGLSWALFASGTSTAVVSQWEVDSSSTTSLMIGFHQRLLARGTRAASAPEALRQAAIAVMKNPDHRHPFYWAGFISIGAR